MTFEEYRSAAESQALPERMWSVELFGRGREHLRLVERPVPRPGPGQLLLRSDAVGLCASDYKIVLQGAEHSRLRGRDLSREPVRLGHEVSLTVVAVGPGLEDRFAVGQRYALQPDIYYRGRPMAYGYRLPGALCHYGLAGPEIIEGGYLLAVEDRLGYAQVALTEPWACVLRAYENHRRSRSVKPGGTAWYVGAGPLGLMHIEKGLADGARHIIVSDLRAERLAKVERTFGERARRAGVTLTLFNPAERPASEVISPGSVDDIIILAPSREATQQAFEFLAQDGFLNVFAGFPQRDRSQITVNLYDMHYRNWTLLATSGSPIEALIEALEACREGRIDPNNVVAAVGGLRSAIEGIDHLAQATFPGRIVIYPHLDIPLRPVEELTGGAPWSTEAEEELFRRALAEGRLSRVGPGGEGETK